MKTSFLLGILSLTVSSYAQCPQSHTVQSGDICYNIAQNNGLSVDQLIGLNPGINCEILQIGQVLCLSGSGNASTNHGAAPTSGSEGCSSQYSVVSGDICFNIAQNNGLSVDQLIGLNPGLNCDSLQINQILCLSESNSANVPSQGIDPTPSSGGCNSQYTVGSGDICYNIAQDNGISLEKLQSMNSGLNCDSLQIGQVLCLSGSGGGSNNVPSQGSDPTLSSGGCSQQYTIASGDICYNIAQDNGLSVDQLINLNSGLNCENLQIGQILCLNGGGSGSSSPTSSDGGCNSQYTVGSGDICFNIAQNNGLSVDQLIGSNPGLNCDNLQVGQVLCLSGSNSANAGSQGTDPKSNDGDNISDPSGSEDTFVSYDQFAQAVEDCGYPRPSEDKYKSFISSYSSAGGITSKQELAMFLAEIIHESGGLQYKSEIRCQQDSCPNDYRSPSDDPKKFYYGRGYIQLTWSYNYKAASGALYGDNRLVENPDMVTSEQVAWDTAYWFWKANVHDDTGVQSGQFGSATNKINGGLECSPCRGACETRFQYYQNVLFVWGMNDVASNAGC